LIPPYPLAPGRTLVIPPPREHVVQAGDTVYNISRRYGVDQSSLVAANGLMPPYTIFVGQRLKLPATVRPPPAATVVASAPPATAGAPLPNPTVTSVELAPPPAGSTGVQADPPAALPLPPRLPGEAPTAGPTPPSPVAPATAAVPQPLPLSGGKFLWPVSGKIISRFGAKQGGLHNDGINIAAPRGTPVRATENGVVAYAGNELRGFGNLLLIRHADGWVSAYAHNETLLVKRGDRVQRGQTIAHVGATGNVSSPQLHFELRRGANAVDPLSVLGSQNAALSRAAAPDAPPDPG
jgi:murein DD-endopeptidase MepM/ murein hydrolase activator NlpD